MLLNLTIFDVIDIILVAIILFQFYRLIRGTAAFSIFLAIFFIYIFWLVVKALNMELVGSLLGQVIGVGVIALIVVFQQEIRMFLLIMGNRYINGSRFPFNKFSGSVREIPGRHKEAVEIVRAAESMSLKKIGALIVIGRTSRLDIFSEGGEKLKALISAELLETIFVKNSPLHDGAVLIEDGLILAARCPLPLTDQVSLPASYGMRHRAAIGMSEHTDAIIVVVSEETGQITVVQTGIVNADISANELREILSREKL